MQVRTFDVIPLSVKSWGFCDNELEMSKFELIFRSFVSIMFVGNRDYLLYYLSSPLDQFTALVLARVAKLRSVNIEV